MIEVHRIGIRLVAVLEHCLPAFADTDHIGRIIRVEETVTPIIDVHTEFNEFRVLYIWVLQIKFAFQKQFLPFGSG